jgi:hypothetical protein
MLARLLLLLPAGRLPFHPRRKSGDGSVGASPAVPAPKPKEPNFTQLSGAVTISAANTLTNWHR